MAKEHEKSHGFAEQAQEQPAGLSPEETAGAEQEASGAAGETGKEEDMAAELTKARTEVQDLQDKLLRLAAEMDNFKKRMQREREAALKYAEENLLRELLPSLDNLERAVIQGRSSEAGSALLAGVEMTSKGLLATLEKFGLKHVAAVGQPFDPNFHEALAMEATDTVAENHILQEYMKGYMFKDRLLRAAKVVVSKSGGSGNE